MVHKKAYTYQPASNPANSSESCCDNPALSRGAAGSQGFNVALPPPEPLPTEICISPLLWSESFGLLVDG